MMKQDADSQLARTKEKERKKEKEKNTHTHTWPDQRHVVLRCTNQDLWSEIIFITKILGKKKTTTNKLMTIYEWGHTKPFLPQKVMLLVSKIKISKVHI